MLRSIFKINCCLQVRTAHMKACSKKNHISTAALLDMVKGHKEAGSSSPSQSVNRKRLDLNLKDVLQTADVDFKKPPPPKRKKRKQEEAPDQLQ